MIPDCHLQLKGNSYSLAKALFASLPLRRALSESQLLGKKKNKTLLYKQGKEQLSLRSSRNCTRLFTSALNLAPLQALPPLSPPNPRPAAALHTEGHSMAREVHSLYLPSGPSQGHNLLRYG